MLAGKQRRSLSNWHTTHRNLCDDVSRLVRDRDCERDHNLHAIYILGERIDDQLLIFLSPPPHISI